MGAAAFALKHRTLGGQIGEHEDPARRGRCLVTLRPAAGRTIDSGRSRSALHPALLLVSRCRGRFTCDSRVHALEIAACSKPRSSPLDSWNHFRPGSAPRPTAANLPREGIRDFVINPAVPLRPGRKPATIARESDCSAQHESELLRAWHEYANCTERPRHESRADRGTVRRTQRVRSSCVVSAAGQRDTS